MWILQSCLGLKNWRINLKNCKNEQKKVLQWNGLKKSLAFFSSKHLATLAAACKLSCVQSTNDLLPEVTAPTHQQGPDTQQARLFSSYQQQQRLPHSFRARNGRGWMGGWHGWGVLSSVSGALGPDVLGFVLMDDGWSIRKIYKG